MLKSSFNFCALAFALLIFNLVCFLEDGSSLWWVVEPVSMLASAQEMTGSHPGSSYHSCAELHGNSAKESSVVDTAGNGIRFQCSGLQWGRGRTFLPPWENLQCEVAGSGVCHLDFPEVVRITSRWGR